MCHRKNRMAPSAHVCVCAYFGMSPPPHECRKELEGRPGMGGVEEDGGMGGGVKGRREREKKKKQGVMLLCKRHCDV